ncbi:MAG: putative toxin-antitoxin system toxin component, PIN family [Elusimicrobia bacterium]|nr:putative toxin-antitoxin system toxin component, PIN family [Elusimicrobiota bacterium]
MRVVFDSNVLIAAFAAHGLCDSLFELCQRGHQIVVSEQILQEVERGLTRKVKAPAPVVRQVLSYLRKHCLIDRPVPVPADACRDPDDAAILGLAAAARAECLVSGDKDLLVLKRYHESVILSPRQLYERLRRKN